MKNLPEMVERVGIAIHEVPRFPLETQLQRTARAAIEAMMTPTPEMCAAGMAPNVDGIGSMYRAMLSEALSPSLKEQERT